MTRKGLDVSHRDVSDIAYPQHDVCFLCQHDLDVSPKGST